MTKYGYPLEEELRLKREAAEKKQDKMLPENQLPTQLYSAKDPEGLTNALKEVSNNPFLKALGYSDQKTITDELVGLP